jgi:hypothetical protein
MEVIPMTSTTLDAAATLREAARAPRRIGCVCEAEFADECVCDRQQPRQLDPEPHDPAACAAYADAQRSLRSVACPSHWLSEQAAALAQARRAGLAPAPLSPGEVVTAAAPAAAFRREPSPGGALLPM